MDHSGKIVPFIKGGCEPAGAEESLKILKLYMTIRKPSDRVKALRMMEEFVAGLKDV